MRTSILHPLWNDNTIRAMTYNTKINDSFSFVYQLLKSRFNGVN